MANRGGSRKHPAGCSCGKCPKMGRPKQERPTNTNVASKVLKEAKAEELWMDLINLEKRRLGLIPGNEGKGVTDGEYRGNFSIIPLTNLLRYLEDRAYGRPVDTVNHLHDKPIDVNLTVSLADEIQKARKRASLKS